VPQARQHWLSCRSSEPQDGQYMSGDYTARDAGSSCCNHITQYCTYIVPGYIGHISPIGPISAGHVKIAGLSHEVMP
jgi:hypothetical protein